MGMQWKQWETVFSWASKITADGDCNHEIKTIAPWKKICDETWQHIKKQRHHFADKGPYSQSYGVSSSHVWMWELDHKGGGVSKNWLLLSCCAGEDSKESLGQWGDLLIHYDTPSPLYRRRQWHPTPVSCLENPMDRRAWWAKVHGVAKSWTRLSDFNFTFHFHALEKEMATHSSVLVWRIPETGETVGLLSMGLDRVRQD